MVARERRIPALCVAHCASLRNAAVQSYTLETHLLGNVLDGSLPEGCLQRQPRHLHNVQRRVRQAVCQRAACAHDAAAEAAERQGDPAYKVLSSHSSCAKLQSRASAGRSNSFLIHKALCKLPVFGPVPEHDIAPAPACPPCPAASSRTPAPLLPPAPPCRKRCPPARGATGCEGGLKIRKPLRDRHTCAPMLCACAVWTHAVLHSRVGPLEWCTADQAESMMVNEVWKQAMPLAAWLDAAGTGRVAPS